MKLLVALPDAEREKYGIEEELLSLDLDALLKLAFDDVVALEDEMDGGPSLALLRLTEIYTYSAKALRAVGWLALKQAGKDPKWTDFKPNPGQCFYVLDKEEDAGPPARRSGASSAKAPARTSSKSAPTSRSSTTSRRTR